MKNEYPLWLGYTSMTDFLRNPITIHSATDYFLKDDQGKVYVDLMSGTRNVILGYSQREIADAMLTQLELLPFARGASFGNTPASELATKLAKLSGIENPRVLFHSSGSEAVECAIKLVRQLASIRNDGRNSIITFDKGYHGQTITALSSSGEYYSKEPFVPWTEGFITTPVPEISEDFNRIQDLIESDSTVGAVMIEPILTNAGVISLPPDYLRLLRELCSQHNILLICDEISTGLGRCGVWFVSEGTPPDILLLGKTLTNGYFPLSAVIVSCAIWKEFDSNGVFRHGQTHINNPVGCAAALSTISIMERLNVPQVSLEKGKMIMQILESLKSQNVIVDCRGLGLLFVIVLSSEINAGKSSPKWLQNILLDFGYVVGQIDNTILLSPPISISEETMTAFSICLAKILAAY